ncbi:hypothetical protein [Vibrio parahaemolyticus]|uniref:hypothetical protein n=1 Tax=Vibrio parahaemolyticus TaxID=670 RepID=UPI00111C57AC|nr:hypothetical protein [Vibrio parahaemolyticus]EJG0618263.1 hypothetical protein [Vibrio parahaemolyticus]EJG0686016.1 hypothetical protein [Vibrio parahaemolyticus]EJG0699225.1 hypothetical protein [Vibrio parahaemolyticus]EJG1054038.1 hypothetical protein [Vibrio parahaemolyticus]EJG1092291.1 hypothetical protein [Vibrio parahaemolyticus]
MFYCLFCQLSTEGCTVSTLSTSQLNEIMGWDRRRVRRVLEDAGIPGESVGASVQYPAKAALIALLSDEIDSPAIDDPATEAGSETASALYNRIRAEKMQVEIEKMRGELVDEEEVRKYLENVMHTVRHQILDLPGYALRCDFLPGDRTLILQSTNMLAKNFFYDTLLKIERDYNYKFNHINSNPIDLSSTLRNEMTEYEKKIAELDRKIAELEPKVQAE